MSTIHAKQARLPDGWARGLRLTIEDGTIAALTTDAAPAAGDARVDTLLPALGNLHSHAFQRAMAGMTEFRAEGHDSFWTWRELMYRFLDRLDPEQMGAIAALAFMEMQEAGFAAVGEFHYVHHQPGGGAYDDVGELSKRVFAAADLTGIGLTHLPVLYTYGGAGRAPLTGGQARFGNDVARFLDLVAAARDGLEPLPPDARVGIAPHSLRATAPDDLQEVLAAEASGPIHVHVAEQPKEVADVEAWLGARPVAWLLENVAVDATWCLIHATHMTAAETTAMAKSGAVAGLCPITEANLGDGPFNGPDYLGAGGAFGVGSDSNVRVSMVEELRTLEYSQRLRDLARNVLCVGEGSVGAGLYLAAARGGAQALGRESGAIAEGCLADLVAVDGTAPALCALDGDRLLDGLVFAAGDAVVRDVWSAGRHRVQGGRHVARDRIVADYRAAMSSLLASL